MERRSKRRPGFTLMEVLLVLVILGLLATVAILATGGIQRRAKIDATKIKLGVIGQAVKTYQMHVGHYPTDEEGGLTALTERPTTFETDAMAEKWSGPYLEEAPTDAWDQPFMYEELDPETAESMGAPFKLWSTGPDMQDGTDDDIRNWKEEI